ncbi:unnamed protein product [Effrenium voratum]|nr:unnamed protein product [Effrenium voratum]CAJ1426306.1 unnamed protein product [Effrenium voratum]
MAKQVSLEKGSSRSTTPEPPDLSRKTHAGARRSMMPGADARRSILPGRKSVMPVDRARRLSERGDDGPGAEAMFGALRRGHAVNVGISSIMIEQDLIEVPMFKNCSSSFVSRLAQDASETTRAFGEGQLIHEAGDPGKSMVLVLRGVAHVTKKDQVLVQLGKGEQGGCHYGETMLLGLEQVWRVSLVSVTSSMVCEIRRESFRRLLEDFTPEANFFESFFDVTLDQLFAGTRTNTCDIFTGLSQKTLEMFDENMVRRIYFPGETVLHDEESKELVLLQDGSAAVEIAGRTVRTETRGAKKDSGRHSLQTEVEEEEEEDHRPACFGELEFLGLSPVRKTAVKALTPCICRVLSREMVLHIAQDSDAEVYSSLLMQMFQKKIRSVDNEQASVLADFVAADCSPEFLHFLAGHLEARLYPEGKLICDLNRKSGSRSLQMVMSGLVRVTGVQNKELPFLRVGGVFGRMAALSLRPRPTGAVTLHAAGHCCVEVLHQDVVVRALELYHDQREKVLMLDQDKKAGTNPMGFVEIVASSRIFSSMSLEFVKELATAAIDRIFMPGDAIMHQGAVEYSMFILVTGTADVFVSDTTKEDQQAARGSARPAKSMSRVSHLSPGAICGELAMLGITPTRSATIRASSLCILWEVTQDKAMAILDRYQPERELFGAVIVRNLDISVPGRLLQLPLLKSFDRKLRMLLTLYCERHAFFPDQQIVKEGEAGDKCFIFNLGPAVLQKKGFTVKTFSPGSHFGCDHMLGINRLYCGSLIAMTVCHVLAVSRGSYLLALEQYPSQKANQQLLRQQRIESRDLRQAIQRITIRKSIWQRYQGEVKSNMFFLSETDLVQRFLKGWHEAAKALKLLRLERLRKRQEVDDMIENWRLKNEANFKKAEQKRREKEILRKNLTERGPLEYLDPEPSKPSLPRLPQKQTKELVSILKAWPSPRPSPHYSLRVWNVMGQELAQDGQGCRLLPMLQGTRKRDKLRAGEGSEGSEEADVDELLESAEDHHDGHRDSHHEGHHDSKSHRINELVAAAQEARNSFLG